MKAILLTIVVTFFVQLSYAQDNGNSDMQVPSTPGMNIIGVQNMEISNPGNYTGVYTSLISSIVSNNGTIPTDLSLEFSPYYLESRNLTYTELENTDIYRDFKISIASTNVIASDSSTFPRVGIGFKTNLLNGNVTMKSTEKKDVITLALANDINSVILKLNLEANGNVDIASIPLLVNHINEENNDLKQKVEKLIIEYRENKNILRGKLEELKAQIEKSIEVDDSRWNYSLRTGNFLEFAGALAIDFPNNNLKYSEIKRWGVWLSYKYRPKDKFGILDLGTIIRLSNHSFNPAVVFDDKALFGDIGGGINVRVPNTKITISSEWVWKFGFTDLKASDGDNQYTFKSVSENKWNISFGYRITTNTLWTMSLSELDGNSDYLKEKAMQLLMGISASIVPLKN